MIEQINHIADLWWSGTVAMFWQVSVLIILIGCVDLIIRRWAWPQLRYALWLMVLIKLVLPPTISLSTSITSRLQPLARQIVTKEIQRENLNTTTAMILANIETAVVESPVEAVSFRNTVTEQQPALVVTGSEYVAGESPNAVYVKPIWQAYTMAVWLAGMFILGGWLIIKLLHLRKEDHQLATTASLPASFYDSMARCAERLELRRIPKVVLTRRVACPAVFGMVRPVLLMPIGYLSKMTRRDTENMLLHELAHIKRGDLWVHSFNMLLQIVYWYNPLLWLARNQMHHLRELCCDATVARLLKEGISEYRQTLIDVARRFLTKSTEPGLGLLGLFEDSNRLLVRLNWLKKETWRHQKMKKLTIIIIIGLMFAFVLPMAKAKNPQAEDTTSSEQLQIEKENPEKDNGDPTKDTMDEKLPNKASQLSNHVDEAADMETSTDEGKKANSLETEGTAQLDVTVSLTVRGKKIDDHHARVRLLDAKDRHVVSRIEKGENGRYLFTGIPAGKYVVEAYFWDSYPKEFENVTLAKGEQKSIAIDSKTEQLARIQVAGKLLDKRTGRGIEKATVRFVGAPDDNAITYPDGSFATHAKRSRFHQIYVRLDEKAFRGGQSFGIRMNNHINEDLAANLQIHIGPENLSQRQILRDEDGDGIFCDGIQCVICNPVQQPNQHQLSQKPWELEVQLKQLQFEKQKLEKELQALAQARQAEHAEHQASLKAKEAALKAKEAKNKGEKANSQETEGTAQLDVTVSLTVRGKKIDNHRARVRLLDAKNHHQIQRIEKAENGRYLFTGIPAGKYVVEAYFMSSYPKEFENVTLVKGEQKSILIDSKTEQLARIQVAGKLLDKRTGKGVEGATVHFVGAPKDNAISYPDGSFATLADRWRFHQILGWLDDKGIRGNRLRDNQRFGIRMNNNINEDLAANLQIHIDPEHLSLRQELRDEDGDGIFCDGVGCVVCPAERQKNQQQLSQVLQALQAQLKQLQIEKQKLEKELQALTQAKQAEIQAAQAALKAKNAALKAQEAEKAKD